MPICYVTYLYVSGYTFQEQSYFYNDLNVWLSPYICDAPTRASICPKGEILG